MYNLYIQVGESFYKSVCCNTASTEPCNNASAASINKKNASINHLPRVNADVLKYSGNANMIY